MSDNVLSVIPADPHWLPGQDAADRAAALVADLVPGDPDDEIEIDVTWHEGIGVVDSAQNLERIGCPLCGASIDVDWWREFVEKEPLSALECVVPCCSGATTLDALAYEWPCGFARFEIAVWNPDRGWFTDDEMAALGAALGHPVRQVFAHI
ncbi:hypothetical protein [Herbidospora sp. RD11066]